MAVLSQDILSIFILSNSENSQALRCKFYSARNEDLTAMLITLVLDIIFSKLCLPTLVALKDDYSGSRPVQKKITTIEECGSAFRRCVRPVWV